MLAVTITPMSVNAQLPMCEMNPAIGLNCTFLTPTVTECTNFTYDIINTDGQVVANTTDLELVNGDVYGLNFTLVDEKDEYVIRLCDGTTREVRVGGDPLTFETAVGIIMLAAIVGLGFMAHVINSREDDLMDGNGFIARIINSLLVGIQHLFVGMIIWLLLLAVNVATRFADTAGATRVVAALNTFFTIYMWLAVLATIILLISAFIAFLKKFQEFGDPKIYKLPSRNGGGGRLQ